MLITTDRVAVGHACVEDELRVDTKLVRSLRILLMRQIRGLEGEEVCLKHVISIRMCAKFEDVMLKLVANHKKFVVEGLWILSDRFDQSLNCTRAVDIH